MRRRCTLVLPLLAACALAPPRPRPPAPVPAGAAARLLEADRLRRQGRLEESAVLYREALSKSDRNVRAHVGLQEIGLRHGRHLALRRAYRAMGDPYLAGRLEGDPRRRDSAYGGAAEPWRSFGRASAAAADGDLAGAARGYRDARDADPGLTWARVGLGRALLGLGQLAEAETEFRAVAWADPAHPMAPLGLSLLADRRGSLAGAFDGAFDAYSRAPGEEHVAARLASVARRVRAPERVRRAAERLDEAAGARAQLFAAELWLRLGDPARAAAARDRAVRAGATAAEIDALAPRTLPAPVGAFVARFTRGVEMRYRHYAATGEKERLRAFVAWARGLYERATKETLGPPGAIRGFTFVGRLVDPSLGSDEPLVRACARHGLLLVLGQRAGGPPEALLADIVRREPMRRLVVRGAQVEREAVWTGRRRLSGYLEWSGGGDVAGVALDRFILIDLAAVARWQGDLERRRRRLEPFRDELVEADALLDAPVDSVADPAGVADRLFLAGPIDMAEEVRVHEEAHLVDAVLHLPVGDHPLRNLGLAFRRGFSARRVMAYLERNAQVAAVAEGPAPHAALGVCCDALGGRGPHAEGYTEIVQGFVDLIAEAPARFPAIDAARVIVQQLHRLSADEIRAIARELMDDWGITGE